MNNTFEHNNSFEDKRLENTLENRIADKVENIFDEASENPHKYARIILTKDYSVFAKPKSGIFRVKEAIITTRKGENTDVFHFVPEDCNLGIAAVIRNNKYIAYSVSDGEKSKEYLFETLRKDRTPTVSAFYALLYTEIGTISLICDNKHENFLYTEFNEISDEPSFFNAVLETLNEVQRSSAGEVCENEQE